MNISSAIVAHHGIVAGMYDDLGIGQIIDELIPKHGQHKLAHSVVLKAMVLNALGFNERRLYIFPKFFTTLATERLLGPGVIPADLNDDVLGRTLDRIYDYGATDLFLKIVLQVMQNVPFGTQLLHADTTSVSVHGNDDHIDGTPAIQITYGHTKDNRPDLKQFVLGTITNQHGIPLFAKTYSGNASDKQNLIESIRQFRAAVQVPEATYFIADSALYTAGNIQTLGQDLHWITRVPSTITEAKTLLRADVPLKPGMDARYSFHETRAEYGGVPQKWILVQSQAMQARKEKTFEKSLEKLDRQTTKSFKKLLGLEFACEKDAQAAADHWATNHPWYRYTQFTIVPGSRKVERKRGRPRKDEERLTMFSIQAEIARNPEVILAEREKLGRFILASNDLSLSPETMLEYYKNQSAVEKGFRFLKDKSFRISEVYLKKPERIEALSMVMVLTLLLYSVAEWLIRKRLQERKEFIPNPVNKPTQKPTLKWIFTDFLGVIEVKVDIHGAREVQLTNLNESARKIIAILGGRCEYYYA
ncbi:mobile element protein [hydrocarbon metagenome]|uniref:Mobile element protein n=1 Tax=hydrocarbon metagenome TaxID=938273 RepID=A0A0W8FDT1_9ZZZZ